MVTAIADEIQEFVRRDRRGIEASRRAHWAHVFQRDGWRVVWDAAQALMLHARNVQPGFPDERARAADLAHHRTLRATLDRAAYAFPRR
jgi:hypothetical protein